MISIRALREEDYDCLIEVWKESGLEHRPAGRDQRDRISRELAGGGSVFLVAEEADRIIGVVLGTHDGRKGWINRLAVLPSHRRRGIARRLVDEVEARLDAMGIGIITCLIEEWNQDSMTFFGEIGYVEHRECVYFSKRLQPDI